MVKITKRKRREVCNKIEDTLDSFCRAECPHAGHNVVSNTCLGCPIRFELRGYGIELGFTDAIKKSTRTIAKHWTPEEVDYMNQAFGQVPVANIADKLGRTTQAIYKKRRQLRGE